MAYIEGGRYQSSAAMGSSCQELSNGLLLDKLGYTIVKTEQVVFWSDYQDPDKVKFLPMLTKNQQLAVNIYRQKFSIDCGLFFLVLGEHGIEVIKGTQAQAVLNEYRRSRYCDGINERDNFPLLLDFVVNKFGKRLYQFSVPYSETKPMYQTRRGARSKNRGKKK
jgi:hypothetical protein